MIRTLSHCSPIRHTSMQRANLNGLKERQESSGIKAGMSVQLPDITMREGK